MNKVCFINGSPRIQNSCSSYLIEEVINMLDGSLQTKEFFMSSLMKDKSQFNEVVKYNKIVFVSPLYIDSLPGPMIEFMKEFEEFVKTRNISNIDIYAIINCGFLEGHQNHIALDIMRNYTKRLNLNWRFGIGVGGGEFMKSSKSMPLKFFIKNRIYNAFLELKEDLEGSSFKSKENILTNPRLYKWMFMVPANKFWIDQARENGLNKKDIFRKLSI